MADTLQVTRNNSSSLESYYSVKKKKTTPSNKPRLKKDNP